MLYSPSIKKKMEEQDLGWLLAKIKGFASVNISYLPFMQHALGSVASLFCHISSLNHFRVRLFAKLVFWELGHFTKQ